MLTNVRPEHPNPEIENSNIIASQLPLQPQKTLQNVVTTKAAQQKPYPKGVPK